MLMGVFRSLCKMYDWLVNVLIVMSKLRFGNSGIFVGFLLRCCIYLSLLISLIRTWCQQVQKTHTTDH